MKKIEVEITNNLDVAEFKKCICFISKDLIEYKIGKGKIEFIFNNEIEENELRIKIEKMMNKFQNTSLKIKKIWELNGNRNYQEQIFENDKFFSKFNDGILGLSDEAIFLFDFFEQSFEKMALEMGAIKKRYPVLLDISKYKKTGYLKNSPQYSMFCCDAVEDMSVLEEINSNAGTDKLKNFLSTPKFALSPSACFHVYIEQENKVLDNNSIYTFTQSVFRNEGRLNYCDLGRLRDYHVREVVFVGDEEFVVDSRKKMVEKVIRFLENLNMYGEINISSDAFILPKMQKYKKIQLLDKCKYELNLNVSNEKMISVSSYNLHGTAFTFPFNINVKDKEQTVTGCVGFGLERWVIAFISQFGFNRNEWPEIVKNAK